MSFERYASAVRAARTAAGRAVAVFHTIASTNDLGKRLARGSLRDGRLPPACDLVAWHQSHGRGRGDHRWSSPSGAGVWATQVRSIASPAAVQSLPLRVAVGLHRVLDPLAGGRCRLRWPNDLMVEERKLGGILIETVILGELAVAIIGFGINHHPALERFAAPAATSVARESPAPLALGALCGALLASVDQALDAEAEVMLAAYRRASVHRRGDTLACRTSGGFLTGVFLGLDDHGFLRLSTASGEQRLAAAEVRAGHA